MGIGLKAHKDFQLFLAGWNARLKNESIRRDIMVPLDSDEAFRAFHDWQAKQRLARTKQIRKRNS